MLFFALTINGALIPTVDLSYTVAGVPLGCLLPGRLGGALSLST